MDSLDFYRHCEDLKVIDAILLLIDLDPGEVSWKGESQFALSRDPGNGYIDNFSPPEFKAAFTMVTTAIETGTLPAQIKFPVYESYGAGYMDMDEDEKFAEEYEYVKDEFSSEMKVRIISGGEKYIFKKEIDWSASLVNQKDFISWLGERGIKSEFFLPEDGHEASPQIPGYLDPTHKCYSSKLAAAIHAWEAVSEVDWESSPKTVRRLLEEWLENNYQDYERLIYRGKKNSTGVEQTAKTANWRPDDGA